MSKLADAVAEFQRARLNHEIKLGLLSKAHAAMMDAQEEAMNARVRCQDAEQAVLEAASKDQP